MREIPVVQFTEQDNTVTLLNMCLDNGGKQGLDLSALRARNRVADGIEKLKTGDVIKLEDADFATAQNCVREVRWIKYERHLITFAEQFSL